ncbi:putative xylanase/chitin deacetylase [Burkholderiales bacterium JOSHI_001]|nr:putative xylanase/chitin deacetylase [Burkholderiales bacterium JOSHI_001]
MKGRLGGLLAGLWLATAAHAGGPSGARPQEIHQRLDTRDSAHAQDIALTLDACGGAIDPALIDTLVRLRIPATLFVTRRWLARHPQALRDLQAHGPLFEIQNHGAEHVPAVIGQRLYGMAGAADAAAVAREVSGGAQAIVAAGGRAPTWFRGAGAAYDAAGQQAIAAQGHRIAGFSLNADDGATLGAAGVAARLRRAKPGDIVIAHMNHPTSGTARGFAAALPELQQRGLRFVTLSQAAGVLPGP